MQVYHSVYGQGTKLGEKDGKTTVRFDNGVQVAVPSEELSQVLHS